VFYRIRGAAAATTTGIGRSMRRRYSSKPGFSTAILRQNACSSWGLARRAEPGTRFDPHQRPGVVIDVQHQMASKTRRKFLEITAASAEHFADMTQGPPAITGRGNGATASALSPASLRRERW
jgi:hypothetical protein